MAQHPRAPTLLVDSEGLVVLPRASLELTLGHDAAVATVGARVELPRVVLYEGGSVVIDGWSAGLAVAVCL